MYIVQLSANAVQFLRLVCDASSGHRMGMEGRMGEGTGEGCGCVHVWVTAQPHNL